VWRTDGRHYDHQGHACIQCNAVKSSSSGLSLCELIVWQVICGRLLNSTVRRWPDRLRGSCQMVDCLVIFGLPTDQYLHNWLAHLMPLLSTQLIVLPDVIITDWLTWCHYYLHNWLSYLMSSLLIGSPDAIITYTTDCLTWCHHCWLAHLMPLLPTQLIVLPDVIIADWLTWCHYYLHNWLSYLMSS